jgi:hypothetical protein
MAQCGILTDEQLEKLIELSEDSKIQLIQLLKGS